MPARRLKRVGGSVLLAALLLTPVLVLAHPDVHGALARAGQVVASGLDDARDSDLLLEIPAVEGVEPGVPIHHVDAAGNGAVVAHVVSRALGPDGRLQVRVRFAPGAARPGPWALRAFAPSRRLGDALDLAVPPDTAQALGSHVLDRLGALWEGALGPAVEERLPAFLARIDPNEDTEAARLLELLSESMAQELQPHLDGLLNHVTDRVDERFDFLDRMGLLWKLVRGDARGLRKELVPVARKAAAAWWQVNRPHVLASVTRALRARLPEIRSWVEGELFHAAREELVAPVLAQESARLEAEGEALGRILLKQVVEAPQGGFRTRFAGMLRHVLLGKRTAVLLLERPR